MAEELGEIVKKSANSVVVDPDSKNRHGDFFAAAGFLDAIFP
jgi:hypothetical protein